jgi:hypothetical protein
VVNIFDYFECRMCGRAPRHLGHVLGRSTADPAELYVDIYGDRVCVRHCAPALAYGGVLAEEYTAEGKLRDGEVLIAYGYVGQPVNIVTAEGDERGQAAAAAAFGPRWGETDMVRIWWLVPPSPELPHGVLHQAVGPVAAVRAAIAEWPAARADMSADAAIAATFRRNLATTSTAEPCPQCGGRGRRGCDFCGGDGQVPAWVAAQYTQTATERTATAGTVNQLGALWTPDFEAYASGELSISSVRCVLCGVVGCLCPDFASADYYELLDRRHGASFAPVAPDHLVIDPDRYRPHIGYRRDHEDTAAAMARLVPDYESMGLGRLRVWYSSLFNLNMPANRTATYMLGRLGYGDHGYDWRGVVVVTMEPDELIGTAPIPADVLDTLAELATAARGGGAA